MGGLDPLSPTLLVGADRQGEYLARSHECEEVCAHAVLRTCVRCREAEREGMTLANGARIRFGEGLAEMSKVMGVSEQWIFRTRMVLRTVMEGAEVDGPFTHCFFLDRRVVA